MMKVLIVEDDPMVCEISKEFCKSINYVKQVITCDNLLEAKKILKKKEFDGLLLDIYFPNASGLDLLSWIRANTIDIDVIMITADKSIPSLQNAFRLGAMDYILKPFKKERLEQALNKIEFRNENMSISNEAVNQNLVDKLVLYKKFRNSLENKEDIRKGLSRETLDIILNQLKNSKEEVTAESLSEKIGLARVTTRRYLEYLVKQEIVSLRLVYGKVGRPQKKFTYIGRDNNEK